MKTVGGLRQLRHRGGPVVTWILPSRRPPTTSSGCVASWRCRREHPARRRDRRRSRGATARTLDAMIVVTKKNGTMTLTFSATC